MIDPKTERAMELLKRAEEMERKRTSPVPENMKNLSPEEIQRVLHELRVHQIELEMQNEELRRIQLELNASKVRYFDLYDLAPAGYCTLSEKGLILEANLTAATLLGVPRSAMVKQPVSRFIIKEDQDIYYLHRKRLFETGKSQVYKLRMLKKDGTSFWAYLETVVAKDADGAPVCRIVMSDITELERTVEELRHERILLLTLMENMPNRIYFKDTSSHFIRVNPAIVKLFGVSDHAQVIGKSDRDFFSAEHAKKALADEKAIMRTGQPILEIEEKETWADGHKSWVLTSKLPLRDSEGNIIGTCGISTDITERKKAEEARLKSEARLNFALQASHIGAWELDLQNHTSYRTMIHDRIFGYETLLPCWTYEMFLEHVLPEDRPDVERCFHAATSTQTDWNFECRIRRADGKVRWILAAGGHEKDSEGKPIRMSGIVQDITEHKKTDERKAELEVQLRQSQKMEAVGQLAGGISHDFNNLLSVINGYSQMLLADPALSNAYHQIKEILRAGELASALTRQLLAFSHRQPMESKIIDLHTTISGMNKMLRRLVRENIGISIVSSPALWKIKADLGQIEQVIMNLVLNACDAMPDGGTLNVETENVKIDKTTRLVHHSDINPGLYVMLSVSDTGCGMDDKVREHIFEPFFTTKEIGKGTGLGLATVYGIVEQNKGYIDVQSEPEKGSVFRIYFPRVDHESPAGEEKEEKAITPRGSEIILLVEDEVSIREMLQNFLESLGYVVLPSGNAREAVELAEKHKGQIHLLLTDVVMPGINGFDLAKHVKDSSPGIKLLFMSGYIKPTDTHGMIKLNNNLIEKPIHLDVLAVKIREILG